MKLSEMLEQARHQTKGTLVIGRIDGTMVTRDYAALVADVDQLCAQLEDLGLRPGHQVGIKAPNCYEWIVWDLAIAAIGGVLVAFPEELQFTEAQATLETYGLALLVHGSTTEFFNDPSVIDLVHADTSLQGKRVSGHALPEINPDLFSKTFSSGTTGHLKGLCISRKGTEMLVSRFIDAFKLSADDKSLIFLPLSNYQQRMSVYGSLWTGASLEFTHFTSVFKALKVVRPTLVISPPILYENLNKIYRPALDGGAALRVGLGGRMRVLITGMAPIRHSILEDFNKAGINLVEVYGVTESGMISWNTPDDNQIGTVGNLIWPGDARLDDQGNIFIRREHPLALGYFLDPDSEGRSVFLGNGEIATGDIGELDASGRLRLKGRKKDVIITSGGKKFHPSEIELKAIDVDGIPQAAVVQSKEDGELILIACIVNPDDGAELQRIRGCLTALNDSLEPYQRFQRIIFSGVPFTLENGCLTRNMKINRSGIYSLYRSKIERLHEARDVAHV